MEFSLVSYIWLSQIDVIQKWNSEFYKQTNLYMCQFSCVGSSTCYTRGEVQWSMPHGTLWSMFESLKAKIHLQSECQVSKHIGLENTNKFYISLGLCWGTNLSLSKVRKVNDYTNTKTKINVCRLRNIEDYTIFQQDNLAEEALTQITRRRQWLDTTGCVKQHIVHSISYYYSYIT